jgi:diguanylate cyclase (GGDEF)-like protein/PAS domain S-box-containing protein
MLYLSEGFEAITGLPRNQALGRNWREVLAWTEETLQTSNEQTVQLFNGEIEKAKYEVSFRHPGRGDLRTLRVSEHASFDEQGRLTFIDGIAEDITEQKRHQEQLEHLAQHDSLTDLPSRSLLGDRLHQAIARAPRHDKLIAVVYIDLDGFKAVNDTHGHAMGDILLVRLAQRLKQALREGDTLARVGGDEFVALLLDLENRDQSAQILERMLQAAAEPIQVEGRTLQVSASLGVAYYPQGEPIQADQLLQQADQAMYQAKQAGKNRYHLFDVQADQLVHGHMETIHALERALQRDELSLHYQPVVDLTDGRVIGAEALLHWVHPEHGLLPASSFLPLVNRYPLSIQLDDWVLQRVLEQIETWKATGLDLPLSLNLGPLALQLEQDDFVARLADALVRHPRVGKGDLILEVEEGHALQGQPQMDRLVRQCRQMGVGFVLDDFGTARAPLGFLKDLPSQGIKIAPSFVRNIPRDAEDLAILLALLGVAGAFRQKTIAEGVETLRHGALLLALGCGCAQGDAIARPMPAQALPQWLKGWQLPAQWQGLQVVSLQDREVLFALVEHQAWMDQLRQHLHTPHTEPPELDHRACLFARWSGKHGLRYRHEDGYARILELHEEIHRRAHQLLAQDRRNERQIEEGFQAIDGHKELLWHEMERLIFPSDMT